MTIKYNFLKDILDEEDFKLDVEVKEQTTSNEKGKSRGINKVLDVLMEIKKVIETQNTEIRKNTMVVDDLFGDRC